MRVSHWQSKLAASGKETIIVSLFWLVHGGLFFPNLRVTPVYGWESFSCTYLNLWLFCDANNPDPLRVKLLGKLFAESFLSLSPFSLCPDLFPALPKTGVLFEPVVKCPTPGNRCSLGCGAVTEAALVTDPTKVPSTGHWEWVVSQLSMQVMWKGCWHGKVLTRWCVWNPCKQTPHLVPSVSNLCRSCNTCVGRLCITWVGMPSWSVTCLWL